MLARSPRESRVEALPSFRSTPEGLGLEGRGASGLVWSGLVWPGLV